MKRVFNLTKHKYESSLTPVRVPQASLDEHTYTYNSIGKLATINQDVLDYELTYGADEQRIEAVKKEYGQVVYTKQYINSASMETKNGEELTYLYAEGQPFAIHKKTVDDEMMYYLHLDHLGSLMSITDQSGIVVETRSYDAWGRPQDPNTWSYQLTPFGALNITDRGYTFHEHLIEFSLINMNGRMYDPVLGRVISPDNYIQAPDNTQSFNRYSYCWNNPLKYSDPSGDIIFTGLAVVTGQWWALPMAISADIGMWQGGAMANGTANPFKWDYSSGKTWGYMAGGAVVGAASGGAAGAVAASGMIGANTAAIFVGSYLNSVGTAIYTGGQTDVSFSLGVASYNFDKNEWNGIWNWDENSVMENIGYSLGALANVGDLLAGFNPGNAELRTENDPNYYKMVDADGNPVYQKDLIGHSQITDGKGRPLIDWGPTEGVGFSDWVTGTNSYERGMAIPTSKMKWDPIPIKGVNLRRITNWNPSGKYNLALNSCVSQTSRALNSSGAFNIGIHPYLLHGQMYLRSIGVRPMIFSHYLLR